MFFCFISNPPDTQKKDYFITKNPNMKPIQSQSIIFEGLVDIMVGRATSDVIVR